MIIAENFYELLGLDRTAGSEEIRKAYKAKALETHPDKLDSINVNVSEGENIHEQFIKVRRAFEVLSDPQQRKDYDKDLGFRSNADIERRWAALGERSQQRVQERQAWANEAEKRYQQRMSDLREKAQIARQARFEQQKQMWEETQMITAMLDALCQLDTSANTEHRRKSLSSSSLSQRIYRQKKRVISAPSVTQGEIPRTSIELPSCYPEQLIRKSL